MVVEEVGIKKYKAEQLRKGAASWFAWIGGLSLVNSVLAISGKQFSFTFGLGMAQVGDALVANESPIFQLLGLFVAFGSAGVFILFSWLARHTWVVFPIGTAVYALDAVLFLIVGDWLSLGFHGFALFLIIGGWRAAKKLESEIATESAATVTGEQAVATTPAEPGAV
jgi:hypothetical protein